MTNLASKFKDDILVRYSSFVFRSCSSCNTGITWFVSTKETRWYQNRCCRTSSSEVIVEQRKAWKIMLDPNTFWPLAPKRLTCCQIWKLTPDIPFHCASSAFCWLKLSVLVWVLGQLKWCPARCTKNGENFALMTSFDLENVDLRYQNLHQKEFLCGPTHPLSYWCF